MCIKRIERGTIITAIFDKQMNDTSFENLLHDPKTEKLSASLIDLANMIGEYMPAPTKMVELGLELRKSK